MYIPGMYGVNGLSGYMPGTNGKKVMNTNDTFNQYFTQALGRNSSFTLHVNDVGDGKVLGAIANGGENSMTVVKPNDFDPEHPAYKVNVWDDKGNLTERTIDLTKVKANSSDAAEMFAYTCYLTDNGSYPEAQDTFGRLQGYSGRYNVSDYVSSKINWVNIAMDMMGMQYDAGNLEGYFGYKKFVDYFGGYFG